MKRRIQHILVLALLANLGLILFQGYWLRSNYLINQADFKKGIQEGLEKAVEQMMFGETRALVLLSDTLRSHTPYPVDSLKQSVGVSDFSFTRAKKAGGFIKKGKSPIDLDTLKGNITVSTIFQVDDSAKIRNGKKNIRLNTANSSIIIPEAQSLVEKVFMSFLDDNLSLEKL
ncbi:MAG: hypothetical protein AAF242_20555, partial [Bacteroidota bacterium]